VLVVTNDFPPRVGGVQQYVWNLVRHLPPDRVSVLAPIWPGWREHDAGQPFPVHRWPASFLWPTGDLARRGPAGAGGPPAAPGRGRRPVLALGRREHDPGTARPAGP